MCFSISREFLLTNKERLAANHLFNFRRLQKLLASIIRAQGAPTKCMLASKHFSTNDHQFLHHYHPDTTDAHKHKQRRRTGEGFWERKQAGTSYQGRNNSKESASLHSCPCPVASQRQAAALAMGTKADCRMEILHWISNWGMNECLQAVCNAIECFCRVMEWQWRSVEL